MAARAQIISTRRVLEFALDTIKWLETACRDLSFAPRTISSDFRAIEKLRRHSFSL